MDRSIIEALLPVKNFHRFHADTNINYQLNRFLVPGLEADYSRIGAKITDFEVWKAELMSAASAKEAGGDLRSAAGLYRAAEFFMSPHDPARRHAFEKFIELFYRTTNDASLARLEIPYESGHLHGVHLKATSQPQGTIVIHAGFDAYVEEFYGLAKAFSAHGYQVVLFDGPGQGSTLMREGIPMTHEWHKPTGAVLDHMCLTNVTLIGISLGGCLALRAAAFEPRIKRVIADDVMLDFFQCVTSRRGKVAEAVLCSLTRLRLGLMLHAVAVVMMRLDLYSRWGIEQGMHVMGTAKPSDYFFKLSAYNTYDISHLVTQDVLIMAGAEDHFVPLDQFFGQLPLLKNARSVTGQILTAKDQAQSHCHIGNLSHSLVQMLAWLEGHS